MSPKCGPGAFHSGNYIRIWRYDGVCIYFTSLIRKKFGRKMSARRERAPTGTSNLGQYKTYGLTPRESARSINNEAMIQERLNTNRSTSSDISTGEMLRRLREASDREKFERAQSEIAALGDYNAFSRPRPSMAVPLRSVFLDPTVNNFPPSRTKSELVKRIKLTSAPHPSYDIDQDGYISQEDYRLAKRFDFDGNGVLDPAERNVAKRVLADEFFHKHAHQLDMFGPGIGTKSLKDNVTKLATSHNFERAYEKLKSIERTLEGRSAKTIEECIKLPDDTLTKHNFFCNRFDTTAWNDFDAIPRSASTFGLHDHGGSRKRLMFSRRQLDIENNERKMAEADAKKPLVNTRRLALITNVAIENN